MVSVLVEVWSDVICPWCYLGKRRLERAIALLERPEEILVRWRAYQLDPTAADEPGDLRQAIEAKYGAGAFESMTGRLTVLGAEQGIDYRFDLAQRVNTGRAHRLVSWAWDAGGAEAGLGGSGAVLDGDAYLDEVEADLAQAATFGLRGVPAFVVERRALISGAQDVETMRQALEGLRVTVAGSG